MFGPFNAGSDETILDVLGFIVDSEGYLCQVLEEEESNA